MSVAKSYAKALFETAREARVSNQEMSALEDQLGEMQKLLEVSKEGRVALLGPATSSKEKSAVVGEFAKRAGFSKLVSQFLALLARKGRLELLSEIRDAFEAVRLEAEGGILGQLVSADPMDSADTEGLARAFEQKLGKRVAFRTSVDPTLLAGMKVTVNGVTYDGTLRSQLQRLRDRLVYGVSTVH